MSISERLSLPFLLPSQAQKHVTHNEALQRLDILVQPAVEGFGVDTPPALPVEGNIWALGATPTGDWAGHADELAARVNAAWLFITPQEGWQALDKPTGRLKIRTAAGWDDMAPPDLNNLPGLGVNASYDSTNRLSLSSPATLFNHEGAGHQLKLNKNADTDTASLLFQTGFSGRTEMGTAGSDDFAIKVSPDGSAWTTALSLDAGTGLASGEAVTQTAEDTTAGRLMKVGDGGLLGSAVPLTGSSALHARGLRSGTYLAAGNTIGGLPDSAAFFYSTWLSRYIAPNSRYCALSIRSTTNPANAKISFGVGGNNEGSITWTEIWHRSNTTVDANGFLKEASPIVRLFDAGTEEPVEPVNAHFTRLGVGHYSLSDVPPLASRGWQIEVPQDANGNRLVFVDTAYGAATRPLTIHTSTVAWDAAWVPGAALDIPAGRWIDLRLDSPEEAAED
jgi:hypothetical protein